jgi:hypothetical protein
MKRSSRSFTPRWNSQNVDEDGNTEQLYRPRDCQETVDLIAYQHLYTDDEIVRFLRGGDLPGNNEMGNREDEYNKANHPLHDAMENKLVRKAFHQRRREIRELTEKLDSGKATIDQDGRLVPVTQPPQPPRANLPPPPPPQQHLGALNDNNDNVDPLLAEIDMNMNRIQQEEQLDQIFEREGQRAAETIARQVQQLRRDSVPEEEFEVILIDPRGDELGPPPAPGQARNRRTLRRLFLAVTAILTAFACVILHALPFLSDHSDQAGDPAYDNLLYELLKVRTWKTHIAECQDLANRTATQPHPMSHSFWDWRLWQQKWTKSWHNYENTGVDCSDGVLHIPPTKGFWSYKNINSDDKFFDHVFGVDRSWFFPCVPVPLRSMHDTRCVADASEETRQNCPAEVINGIPESPREQCFRGVHDGLIGSGEIHEVSRMGHYLIEKGGDHFDVHYDIDFLHRRLFGPIRTLKQLLHERYHQNDPRPVAFRILTTAPMDVHGVRAKYPSTLNHTNYQNWVERSKEHNQRAQYPWPFGVPPKRETCNLMAERQADPRFCILTSIFLNDGAGKDYRGAATLFMDHHPSNSNPRQPIQRGLTVDGESGRVVVSTGGFENLRCRFPTRSGRHEQLQIWWDCGS